MSNAGRSGARGVLGWKTRRQRRVPKPRQAGVVMGGRRRFPPLGNNRRQEERGPVPFSGPPRSFRKRRAPDERPLLLNQSQVGMYI